MDSDGADPRWEAFAAREPYFAILTAPQFRRAAFTPEHEREFFESGDTLVDYVFQLIEQRVAPDFAPTSILEYGCGVGRLAMPLARRAGRRGGTVVAVDRSPAMLAAARVEVERHGIPNMTFAEPAAFEQDTRTFDLISCVLVLQRMPQDLGLALVRRLLSRLAPGGVAVFSVPYASTARPAVRAARWLRRHVPALDAAVNLARRRAGGAPFVANYTYDLSRVMSVVQDQLAGTMNVLLEPQEGLNTALLFVEAPMTVTQTKGRRRAAPDAIDVVTLIQQTSIDDLNRAAEEYFASLKDRDHQLTKPFSQAHEAPTLLAGMAAVLQGLDLMPGATVLEFGAGTGWLSRYLTQLGCRSILLDVSPTALDIARDLYARLPIIGERPAPRFLVFDGRHIDLPDGSVDRVLCFHAFHHVTDPAAMVREFGRILAPGGIAGFAEPGPRHSSSPFSQFEMQTYKVVENDVDVHGVWRAAQASGFSDIKLAVFHAPSLHVSLQEFEDFLAGGETTARWVASTRVFLRNTRTFFLVKSGTARADSRRADGLACTIHAVRSSTPASAGQPIVVDVTVTNAGSATWLPSDVTPGGVVLGAHLYDERGQLLQFDMHTEPLTHPPREVAPRETLQCRAVLPPQRSGRYVIEIDCVAAQIAWFAPLGSKACRLPIDVV